MTDAPPQQPPSCSPKPVEVCLRGPCTKITSDYNKKWFVQSRTTISRVRPRLLTSAMRFCALLDEEAPEVKLEEAIDEREYRLGMSNV